MSSSWSPLLAALERRVLVADGAMGTMLQSFALGLDDFGGLEGCNEILNITRPDVVRDVHRGYLEAGADAIETNTFGANLANLGEYDIPDRIRDLAEKGSALARQCADEYSTPDRPRFVLGSMGPGTKLPTLGHAPYADLRDAYEESVLGMLDGGIDVVLVETSQDLLQTKAAIVAAKRAMEQAGRRLPIIAQVTVEQTGTMLVGSEIGAALTALEPLGIDLIGMNCATGPAEMSEHLRVLAQHAYPIDPVFAPGEDGNNGVASIVADQRDPERLLVLERSYVSGVGNSIRIYEADLRGATDVQHVPALPGQQVRPVRKRLLADLSDFGLQTVDNVEGITWGPRLPTGERTLFLVSDNNFSPSQTTQLIGLAVR